MYQLEGTLWEYTDDCDYAFHPIYYAAEEEFMPLKEMNQNYGDLEKREKKR